MRAQSCWAAGQDPTSAPPPLVAGPSASCGPKPGGRSRTVRKSEQPRKTCVPGLCFGATFSKEQRPSPLPFRKDPTFRPLTRSTRASPAIKDRVEGRRGHDSTRLVRFPARPPGGTVNLILPNLVTEGRRHQHPAPHLGGHRRTMTYSV